MRLRNRKDKAMAPQKTTTVELPHDEPFRSMVDPTVGDWVFPSHWTDDNIRDWLVTHPEAQSPVETITIADGPEPDRTNDRDDYEDAMDRPSSHGETCDAECGGDPNAVPDTELASEREVIEALKADGTYAAGIVLPPGLADTVNSDNYDPRDFLLIHSDAWNELVKATYAEAELGLENKELRKRINALTRGMRKVNKHWSATKNTLKHTMKRNAEALRWWSEHELRQTEQHAEELKRERILTTRVARRLRKARAGRDKRERQLQQANDVIKGQADIIKAQDTYIAELERHLTQ